MKIKFIVAFTMLALGASLSADAQGLYLTGFGGYTFQDKVYGYYGDVIFRDGAAYGGVLSFRPDTRTSVELTYSRQDTEFAIFDYRLAVTDNLSVPGSVNYIMLGGSHSPDFSANIAPYGGLMLGAAIISPKEDYSDEWRFAVGMKLGAIIKISETLGFILQSQLMMPVQGVGLGIGCSGSGCSTGVSTSSTATQFGFTGGLEVKLK